MSDNILGQVFVSGFCVTLLCHVLSKTTKLNLLVSPCLSFCLSLCLCMDVFILVNIVQYNHCYDVGPIKFLTGYMEWLDHDFHSNPVIYTPYMILKAFIYQKPLIPKINPDNWHDFCTLAYNFLFHIKFASNQNKICWTMIVKKCQLFTIYYKIIFVNSKH